jgi:N-acetylglucosamine-6-phosphate deacetylase
MTAPSPLIDLQVNGCAGIDFSGADLTPERAAAACRTVLGGGTAAFLPTLVTSPIEVYRRNLPLVADLIESAEFRGRVLGIHLEGPFISPVPGFVGAHTPEYVVAPDPDLLARMQEWARGTVRILTLAAELPGADALARRARELGMAVAIGHSNFAAPDLARLADAGATAITHLGNGLPLVMPRHDNPLWAGLAEDRLTGMFIPDGHHLPAPVLKVALRAKGIAHTIFVSDACALAGLPPGRYEVFGRPVELEPTGRVRDIERGCLAGAGMLLPEALRRFATLGLLTPEEIAEVTCHNPLRLLGLTMQDVRASGHTA